MSTFIFRSGGINTKRPVSKKNSDRNENLWKYVICVTIYLDGVHSKLAFYLEIGLLLFTKYKW
jgi:hypothetical protein